MKLHNLLVVLAACAIAPLAGADIIGWNCAPDGDGAIVLNSPPTWEEDLSGVYTLGMNETQYWWPAHMLGSFTTDTETDPVVWIRNEVLNDGTIPPLVWTDYHLNITMSHDFAITGAATLPDWIVQNITQPTLQGTEWVGSVDYLGGTPVNLGDWGQFDVQLTFVGSVTFTIEMIPTPEPTSLLLLALGGLLLRGGKR
jgi:hypothetical protein